QERRHRDAALVLDPVDQQHPPLVRLVERYGQQHDRVAELGVRAIQPGFVLATHMRLASALDPGSSPRDVRDDSRCTESGTITAAPLSAHRTRARRLHHVPTGPGRPDRYRRPW